MRAYKSGFEGSFLLHSMCDHETVSEKAIGMCFTLSEIGMWTTKITIWL